MSRQPLSSFVLPLLFYWYFASTLAIVCSLAMPNSCLAFQEEKNSWPEFRGPTGQGYSDQLGLPISWSEKKNIIWKTDIPGRGWSSPVIQDEQIWLTTALDEGKSLRAVCINFESGTIVHDVEVFRVENPGQLHPKNSHASPTPIIDGNRLYVHFGTHGTACLSTDGQILWRIELPYYHHHGPAASPVLVDDLLIINCDGFTGPFWDRVERAGVHSPQFVVGIEAATGQIRWRRSRDGRHSYSTPLAIEVDGKRQVISPGGDRVIAYDPATGEELWWCRYEGYSLTPRPVFGNGLVFVCTGYDQPSLLAIRPSGKGDVTETHIEWQSKSSVPLTPSPLLIGDELYLINDNGIASCLDAQTGKQHWKQRISGNYSASPITAEGRIYFLNERGQTDIIEAGTKYKKLATCKLTGRTLASPATAGGCLFIRSEDSLYRIGE